MSGQDHGSCSTRNYQIRWIQSPTVEQHASISRRTKPRYLGRCICTVASADHCDRADPDAYGGASRLAVVSGSGQVQASELSSARRQLESVTINSVHSRMASTAHTGCASHGGLLGSRGLGNAVRGVQGKRWRRRNAFLCSHPKSKLRSRWPASVGRYQHGAVSLRAEEKRAEHPFQHMRLLQRRDDPLLTYPPFARLNRPTSAA